MQNMYDEKGVKMNKLLKYTFMLLCCFLLMGCLPLDKETDKKLDKDRFRRDLGGIEEAYIEVLKRLGA